MSCKKEEVRVGYYLARSKAEKLNWDELVRIAREEANLNFVALDLDKSLNEQGPFDLIIHKVTDELAYPDNPEFQSKLMKLQEYLHAHPEVVEIDPLSRQRPLVDRAVMSDLILKLNQELPRDLEVKSPAFVVVDRPQEDYTQLLASAGVRFPVVCKTVQACGSKAAHHMGIVFSEKGVHNFIPPFVAQEYINHNATLFKVFVIGEYVNVVRRKSLRDVNIDETDPLLFDSQLPLPPHLLNNPSNNTTHTADPPQHTLAGIAKGIRMHLGLSLFGFDVITDVQTHKHAIVDINYFPGYVGVPDVFHVFLNHFLKTLNNKSSIY